MNMGIKYSGEDVVKIIKKYFPNAEVELTEVSPTGLTSTLAMMHDLRITEEEWIQD